MNKFRLVNHFVLLISILLIFTACGCQTEAKFITSVSIIDHKWYFNEKIINEGSPAEDLLMNVRMVNTLFEDRSGQLKNIIPYKKHHTDFETPIHR